ncbi:MAG: hypothetical protein ACE5JO_11015, partial [Candidatus Binatia bacterium]
GGCAPYGNPALADARTRRLAAEAKHDIVSYCASCRERFSSYRGSLHVLDLVFGSPYDKARLKLPDDSLVQWWHRARLKHQLQRATVAPARRQAVGRGGPRPERHRFSL